MFTAIGCDTSANVTNEEMTYGAACLSLCIESSNMSDKNSCSPGSGCCQTSIPKGLKSPYITVSSLNHYKKVRGFNILCGHAFLADKHSFKPRNLQLFNSPKRVFNDVVLDWVAGNETCEKATNSSSYACGKNAVCVDSENGPGYRCSCREGFLGNPYLHFGCQDIDECKNPESHQCKTGKCKNLVGSYTCQCPFGMHGDGRTGCNGFRITILATVAGAAALVMIICLLLYILIVKKRRDRNFRENGGRFLKHQRVRIYSEKELEKATNHYDGRQKLGEGGFGSVYKGVLPDNTEAVKKFKGVDRAQMNEEFHNEIGIVSQVNHKNVVKLLGLCLETKAPILVYEYISNGTLSQHIHEKKSHIFAAWKNRLRIAAEIALALEYLHSLANPPIVHRDIKSANILLDDNCTAKVADFGASVLISPDQTNIASKINGTFGYLEPEYLMAGELAAKSDVYSFGVVLAELLTGLKPKSSIFSSGESCNLIHYLISSLKNDTLSQILDFEVASDGEMEEIQIVAELAKRCLISSSINRPTMKEVSGVLARLKSLHEDLWNEQNNLETEHLIEKSSSTFSEDDTADWLTSNQSTVVIVE